MARNECIAEGVETPEQLDYLQRQRCSEMQGSLFSRPLPISELSPMLRLPLLPGSNRKGLVAGPERHVLIMPR